MFQFRIVGNLALAIFTALNTSVIDRFGLGQKMIAVI